MLDVRRMASWGVYKNEVKSQERLNVNSRQRRAAPVAASGITRMPEFRSSIRRDANFKLQTFDIFAFTKYTHTVSRNDRILEYISVYTCSLDTMLEPLASYLDRRTRRKPNG